MNSTITLYYQLAEPSKVPVEQFKEGTLVAAKCNKSGTYGRALIMGSPKRRKSDKQYIVQTFYVDYGTRQWTELRFVHLLTPTFQKIDNLAFRCTLICPSEQNEKVWHAAATEYLIRSEMRCNVTAYILDDGSNKIPKIKTVKIPGLDEAFALPDIDLPKDVRSYLVHSLIEPNSQFECEEVLTSDNFDSIVIRLREDVPGMEMLNDAIEKFYNQDTIDNLQKIERPANDGQHCIVQYLDELFYRAEVLLDSGGASVTTLLVDYGWEFDAKVLYETINDPIILETPILAINIRLANVRLNGIRYPRFHKEFANMIEVSRVKFLAYDPSIDVYDTKIAVFDDKEDSDFAELKDLTELVCTYGWGELVENESRNGGVENLGDGRFVFDNLSKKCIPMNGTTISVLVTDRDENRAMSIVPKVFDELLTEINAHLTRKFGSFRNPYKNCLEHPKQGELCSALSKTGLYSRAVVVSECFSGGDKIEVKFLDYGTVEKMEYWRVKPFPKSLLRYPPLGRRVRASYFTQENRLHTTTLHGPNGSTADETDSALLMTLEPPDQDDTLPTAHFLGVKGKCDYYRK